MECRILGRRHFLYFGKSIYHTEQEDKRADIKSPSHGVRNFTCRGCIAQKPCQHKWCHVTYNRTGIAQKRLYRISQPFLLLINHIAHQHLKRLHGHIDRCIKKHKHYKTKNNSRRYSKPKRTGIWQEAHDNDCY